MGRRRGEAFFAVQKNASPLLAVFVQQAHRKAGLLHNIGLGAGIVKLRKDLALMSNPTTKPSKSECFARSPSYSHASYCKSTSQAGK